MSVKSEEQTKAFRRALVDVGQSLSERDVKSLAFEFGVHRSEADSLQEGWQLFDLMMRRTFIEPTKVDPLIELLERRDLKDCCHILESYRKQFLKDPVNADESDGNLGMDAVVTSSTLMKLSGRLMAEWRDVGRALNITDSELYSLSRDHDSHKEINYQMLLSWKHKNGNLATHEVLAEALSCASRSDLAEFIKALGHAMK